MINSIHRSVLQLVAALCLLGAPLVVFAQISDDFSQLELDPATWSLVDPAGDCTHGVLNGWLTIGIPTGTNHDIRGDFNRSARLMQNVTDGDFEIEAGFQSIPEENFQVQGLLVETDPTHFLRLDYYRAGPDLKVSCVTVTGGITKIQGEFKITSGIALWLRLSRAGNTWRGFHSQDGEIWTEAFVFDHVMTVASVGVFGGNTGQSV